MVDVSQLYANISQQLESTPLKMLANKTLPPKIGQIQLLDPSGLKTAHGALATLHLVRIWAWIVVLAAFAGAILLSRRRMHTLMWVGFAIVIAMVATVIGFRITRTYALDQMANPVNRVAALSIWTILLRGLFAQTGGFLALGFVLALGSWIAAGQGRVAGFRASTSRRAAKISHGIWSNPETSGFVRWVARHNRPLEWVAVVIGLMLLMFFSPLSLALVGGVAVGVLAAVVLVEFVASAEQSADEAAATR